MKNSAIQERLLDVFLYLGSAWILWLLMTLSVISIAIAIERVVHFARSTENVDLLRAELGKLLAMGGMGDVRNMLSGKRTHVAIVLKAGVDALDRGPQAAEEIFASAALTQRVKMERGLAFLGTLGNNAPYIGLFGTVLGIIRSFRDLATNTIEGSQAVMAGIAESLVATGVGLLVALPAVAIFNAFQRKIRTQLAGSEAMSRLVLAYAKTRGGQSSQH
jgi:biopolymer transport protein ExbB/TolQ